MGCCTSNTAAMDNMDFSVMKGFNEALSPDRMSSKRSYSSRISTDSSSGVYSRCTTPSRRSIWSRSSTPGTSTPRKARKSNEFNFQTLSMRRKKDIPEAFQKLSICDDFPEIQKFEKSAILDLDNSFGYCTESFCSSTSPPIYENLVTPSAHAINENEYAVIPEDDSILAPTTCNLHMEMYMMTHISALMPKTSSPILQRREATYDVDATNYTATSSASRSYNKWRNYLLTTPVYMVNNVSQIPEAIAGQFSSEDSPAYTDVLDMENVAKRYKLDPFETHRPNTMITSTPKKYRPSQAMSTEL